MAGKQWKRFEAASAFLFGLSRCWANSGESRDFPQDEEYDDAEVIGQCKEVNTLAGNKLTKLCEAIAAEADAVTEKPFRRDKVGVVTFKIRRGAGKKSQPIIAMTFEQFEKFCALYGAPELNERIRKRREEFTDGDD